ncbi:MAG: nucleotidyltransferase family protein [Gemmataceae bacterium]
MHHHQLLGRDIASLLTGSWRATPPVLRALNVHRLSALAPLVQGTGAGALAWWRVRASFLNRCDAARELHQAFRLHTLQAVGHEQCLVRIVRRLREEGIEPIIVKGWSISRIYPSTGLRPYGDVDVCVPPGHVDATLAVLKGEGSSVGQVDVHAGVADLDDRSFDELYARTQLVPLGEMPIRVLGMEDQLRHLALHLMRHGGWRPLWLCDLAALLDQVPARFDWDYCLSGRPHLNDWVVAALGLAGRLLEANLQAVGPVRRAFEPRWLAHTVLGLWGFGPDSNDAVATPILSSLRSWSQLQRALRQRWPNPVRAAFKLGLSPFSRWPRPLVQTVAFFNRATQYLRDWFQPVAASGPIGMHPLRVR